MLYSLKPAPKSPVAAYCVSRVATSLGVALTAAR